MSTKKNYFTIFKFPSIYLWYGYFDTEDCLAYSLFQRYGVPVHIHQEYAHPTNPYKIIICKIRRKYEQTFLEAMKGLVNKMNLLGYTDYEEYCSNFITEGRRWLDEMDGKDGCN